MPLGRRGNVFRTGSLLTLYFKLMAKMQGTLTLAMPGEDQWLCSALETRKGDFDAEVAKQLSADS